MNATILLAALGYFVDIYDLVLFGIVRVDSLKGIGVAPEQLLSSGVLLLNMQMGGMLLGGILWGMLGDRKGRLSVLLGSILIYSLANIANGFVTSMVPYMVLRFIAGVGLSGELGAGVTLVSELMPKETRGYGTALVATIGILGAVVGALVGDIFSWRIAYFVGGGLGLLLLSLRIGALESKMFEQVLQKGEHRQIHFLHLFTNGKRFVKYVNCILIGTPTWFVVGIFVMFSPELGKAFGIQEPISAGKAIMFAYIGLAFGDLVSGFLSQYLGSRKKIVFLSLLINIPLFIVYLFFTHSAAMLYIVSLALGVANGYWAVFVTIAAEQFGTNIRSTVATTVPNFVRGAVIPLAMGTKYLAPSMGLVGSSLLVGSISLLVAFGSLFMLEESHGKDLDYIEVT